MNERLLAMALECNLLDSRDDLDHPAFAEIIVSVEAFANLVAAHEREKAAAGCHVGGEFACPDCDGRGYYTAPPKRQPDDFDSWYASPYAKVLMKSIEEDYSPKRQPLRGEQIYEIFMKTLPKLTLGMTFVPEWAIPITRAIEAAHGIGEKT